MPQPTKTEVQAVTNWIESEQIDLLLGFKDANGKDVPESKQTVWDLIHLNVGPGDLIYRVPNLKSHRNLPYDH